jgi:hypothetical protein
MELLQRLRAKRKAMAKNGAENGAAPKAKIAKKAGRRTKCTEDYVPRFLERIEVGQLGSGSCSSGWFAHFNRDGMADACEPRKVWMFAS